MLRGQPDSQTARQPQGKERKGKRGGNGEPDKEFNQAQSSVVVRPFQGLNSKLFPPQPVPCSLQFAPGRTSPAAVLCQQQQQQQQQHHQPRCNPFLGIFDMNYEAEIQYFPQYLLPFCMAPFLYRKCKSGVLWRNT